jgi:hypothetical protein
MGHPKLERVKAETERELRKKKRRTNDIPKSEPLHARKPDPIRGNPATHGAAEEDEGHVMITGHR